jgi:hypothetical protein
MTPPTLLPDDSKIQQDHEPNDDGDCPEGGWRAWTVVLGAWCAMVPSMGMLNTIGILDAWIGENQLEALPKSQTAWIVSLYAFFLYIGGSCAGKQARLYLWQHTMTDDNFPCPRCDIRQIRPPTRDNPRLYRHGSLTHVPRC